MAVSSLALAWLLLAQTPAPAPGLVPMNGRTFDIPITLDAQRRPQVKRLQLYVSTDLGRTWNPTASAPPEQDKFTYSAPEDGTYWFTVCLVDAVGNQTPPTPFGVAPSLQVLVDTVKPLVKVLNAERQGDEAVVSWEIQEDHPNLSSLHVEYRPLEPSGGPWNTVPLSAPLLKGETRFRPMQPGAMAVRLSIKDSADNPGERETTLPAAAAPAAVPMTSAPLASAQPLPPAVGREQPLPPQLAPVPPPVLPAPGPLPQVNEPRAIAQAGGPIDQIQQVSSMSFPSTSSPSGAPLPRPQVVNDRQISLEYEVRSGPSGLGKVELWVTRDDGSHWEYLSDDPDLRSPITATLPGEGTYGLRLVVQSGAGLGKGAPQAGDLPDLRIQVDLTPPLVRLYEPRPDPYQRDALIIAWSASDPNLETRPVKLEYAERVEGPWQPIAADLPAVGSHTWALPKNVPYRVFLRAIAADTAGNRTVAETRDPVLIDLTKPEIVGVHMSVGVKRPAHEATPMPPAPMNGTLSPSSVAPRSGLGTATIESAPPAPPTEAPSSPPSLPPPGPINP